jgi:isoleucyl-tRNA synthetase
MSYSDFPASPQELEEGLLETWRDEDLFRATLEATAEGEPFVFYEGPPTANGRPGLHHIISRAIKDLVCRYQTMRGRSVTRIAGWDTHGLPVEIEAEKRLGISGKPEIEALGIAEFNRACRDSVFTYKEEWEQLSERIGYWLDYSRPYVTFHSNYVESVWWVLKRFADEGLLYRGHKSVPYCPRCGTALSSHEVAQGYEDVEDPSLTFLVPVLDGEGEPDGRFFAVWTTTPWTVPSNVGLAVHPELTYVEVEAEGRTLIMARERVEAVLGEGAIVRAEMPGTALAGLAYGRPVDLVDEPAERGNAWTVVLEDFVSADDGTGIVHMAPAFGADDYAAGLRHDLPLMRPIDDAGVFLPGVRLVGGLFVKDADPVVVAELERTGRLFRHEMKTHSYPHCWRCRSPLIYMARDSWFAATSTRKDEMLANNDQVSWYPPEVGEKRFGEWLRGNVDWALSRDRYWGTPLPAWVCESDPDHVTWIGSFAELAEHAGPLGDDFDPHRPFIDEITWSCSCGGTMRRTAGVVDVWFDSGCVPYAQWHYPFENESEFEAHFPADFICEGLDQTRGWFYSLMAISTLLGRGPAFRNVIVNDLILDAEGQKMSKSRGNTVNPWDAVADHGADAVRWYLITVSNPWVPKRYDADGVREASRRFFDTLANTYRFFALYASIEGWRPSDADPAPRDRPVLDQWLLSRLEALTSTVAAELDGYQPTRAYREVIDFVDELSNWYVRRSRQRFWGHTDPNASRAAFRTLHEALVEVARLVAPVVPFIADWLHRALTGRSVHLEAFPASDAARRDERLELEMSAARTLVSLGRAAREEVKIRVRQPLRRVQAVVPADRVPREEVLEVVRSELNVKQIEFLVSAEGLVSLEARPNFRALGPRFGKETNAAATAIRALSGDALAAYRSGEPVSFELGGEAHALEPGDLEVVEAAEGDWVVRSENGHVAALDPAMDDELRAEGMARELVNRIQRLRKDTGLEVTDRIRLGIFGAEPVRGPAEAWRDFIGGETLSSEIVVADEVTGTWEGSAEVDLDGVPARLGLSRIEAGGP